MFAYRKVNVYTCTKWILLTLAEVLGIKLVKLDSELIELSDGLHGLCFVPDLPDLSDLPDFPDVLGLK
jgi:hypothetical protein